MLKIVISIFKKYKKMMSILLIYFDKITEMIIFINI